MSMMIAEPPPAYRITPPAVLDSSVLSALVYLEAESELAKAMMRPYALFAPAILPLEVTNAGMNKLRRRVATLEEVSERLAGFDFGCISIEPINPPEVFAVAARYGLSAYDASYLWLAGSLMAPLLSFDRKLFTAAQDYLSGLGGNTAP